jgi:hypothetical protein
MRSLPKPSAVLAVHESLVQMDYHAVQQFSSQLSVKAKINRKRTEAQRREALYVSVTHLTSYVGERRLKLQE